MAQGDDYILARMMRGSGGGGGSGFVGDLSAAMNVFNGGMQKVETDSAYQQATNQLQQINQNVQDAFQKRQQQMQVSQQLGFNLMKAGAPVSEAMGAAKFAGPQAMLTPQQLINQGVQFHRQGDIQQGINALDYIASPQRDLQTQQQNFELKKQQLDFAHKLQLASMTGNKQAANMNFKQAQEMAKMSDELTTKLSGRTPAGLAQRMLLPVNKALDLYNQYATNPNSLSLDNYKRTLVEIAATMTTTGTPTESEISLVGGQSGWQKLKGAIQSITNAPTPADAAKFIKQNQTYLMSMKNTMDKVYGNTVRATFLGHHAALGDYYAQDFANQPQWRPLFQGRKEFQQYLRPEYRNLLTPQAYMLLNHVKATAGQAKSDQLYQALQDPNIPRNQIFIQHQMKSYGVDPDEILPNQSQQDLTYGFRP